MRQKQREACLFTVCAEKDLLATAEGFGKMTDHHVHLCTRTAPNFPSVTQHAHPPACLLMRNNCMDEGGKSSVIK